MDQNSGLTSVVGVTVKSTLENAMWDHLEKVNRRSSNLSKKLGKGLLMSEHNNPGYLRRCLRLTFCKDPGIQGLAEISTYQQGLTGIMKPNERRGLVDCRSLNECNHII